MRGRFPSDRLPCYNPGLPPGVPAQPRPLSGGAEPMCRLTQFHDEPNRTALGSVRAWIEPLDWTPARRAGSSVCMALLLSALLVPCETGFAQQSGEPPKAPETEDVDKPIAEQPTPEQHVVVDGQVTDYVGSGHANVAVTAQRKTEDGSEGELIGTTTTDELGDFKITAPKRIEGHIVVTFSAPLHVDLVREIHVGQSEWPEYLAEQLTGNLVVTGRVTSALKDDPIAGASVTLEAAYNEWYATTDEQGRFTIKEISPGPGEFVVEAEGHGREKHPVEHLEDSGEILIQLKPERIVHIEVVDDLDKPIPGVTLECYDEPRDDFRTQITDKKGAATVKGMHFDAAFVQVRLTHDDYVSSEGFDREIDTPRDRTESTHKFVLPRAGKIAGRVTQSHSSTPLQGARVMTGDEYSDFTPRDWADYQGDYLIRGVPPGPVTVTVHLTGYAPELKQVEVNAARTTQLDIQLHEGALLMGIVKTESGKPVAGALVDTVRWRGSGTLGLRSMTAPDGTFVMENVPKDAFEVVVTARRSGRVVAMVKGGEGKPYEFTVPDPAVDIESNAQAKLRVGDTVPPLTMTTLGGKVIKLSDFRGKTVVLDFWATWCGPCLTDLSHLLEIHEKFKNRKDFAIIAVSLDFDEKTLRGFIERRKLTWTHVFGEAAGAQKAADRCGVRAIPAVFIIGPDGKIIATDVRSQDIVKKSEQALQDNDPT